MSFASLRLLKSTRAHDHPARPREAGLREIRQSWIACPSGEEGGVDRPFNPQAALCSSPRGCIYIATSSNRNPLISKLFKAFQSKSGTADSWAHRQLPNQTAVNRTLPRAAEQTESQSCWRLVQLTDSQTHKFITVSSHFRSGAVTIGNQR